MEPASAQTASGSSRVRLLDLIRSQPGVHKSALCQATGLAWGTVDYHLRLLARSGLVSAQPAGRTTRLFPGALQAPRKRMLALLADEPAARIARLLREQPGHGNGTLSQRLGLSPKVVRRHLRRLEHEGLVEREGTHRPQYRLGPDGHALLASLEGVPDMVADVGPVPLSP